MIYARFSTRFQASIGDQVRACYEAAVVRGLFVSVDQVCFDLAVRGSKAEREGLGRAQQLIEGGGVAAFLAFTTNRLHRKMHRCLKFVEEELVERNVRAIFPKSGVDTADVKRWKMLLSFHAMMDEFVVSMYADNVRAAHRPDGAGTGLRDALLRVHGGADPRRVHAAEASALPSDRRPRDRPDGGADLPVVCQGTGHHRRNRPAAQRRRVDPSAAEVHDRGVDADGRAGDAAQLALSRDLGVWCDPIGLAVAKGLRPQGLARPAAAFRASRRAANRAGRVVGESAAATVSEPKPVGRKPKDGNRVSVPGCSMDCSAARPTTVHSTSAGRTVI